MEKAQGVREAGGRRDVRMEGRLWWWEGLCRVLVADM